MSPREIVRASAGAGKTFRISSRIIGLLASGEAPSDILASTFTRKAAGEILDRVLVRIAEGVLDPDKAHELGDHALGKDRPAEPATDPRFWADVLERIVAELGTLEISTLDSFFARILRAFSNEMGLLPGWALADEPTGERLRGDTLEALFHDHDDGIMVELVRSLHPGQVRRSIYGGLLETVDDIVAADRQLAAGAPGWTAMRKALLEPPDDVGAQAHELADRIAAAEVPTTKSGTPNKRWANARDDLAGLLRAQDWKTLVSKGLPLKVLEAEPGETPTYSGHDFPEALATRVREAIDLARAAIGRDLAMRAEALARLARLFDTAYLERVRSTGALRFDDVTRLIAGWPGDAGTSPTTRPDFFWRLGRRSRHVLLDEFQDTSLLQWWALTPILDRLADGGGEGPGESAALVVVADPKQSIYGWRGAAPAVVDAAAARYALPPEDLAVSWRSSPVVLDVVNQVFTDLHLRPVLREDDTDAETAREWGRAFTPHRAAKRDAPPYPGRVRLWAGPELDGAGNAQPGYFRWVSEHVACLHREMPDLSIGVLTRLNQSVGRIILELAEREVVASQEGGTPLGDSPAVASVFALLRLADHPADGLARYHVAHTPLGPLVGLDAKSDARGAVRVSRELRRELVERGYGPTLSELAARLEKACDARERVRLQHLVELGYRWDRSPRGESVRVSDFLERALSESVETAGDEPIRVMTVHQSKGLEFDIVVLPELHGGKIPGSRRGSRPIAYRPGPTDPVTHLFPPMSKGEAGLFEAQMPELADGRRQARAAEVRDSLGLLYVAMTRARYALELIVPADPPEEGGRKPSTARTHARLVRECLDVAPGDRWLTEGELAWQSPDPPRADDGWTTLPRKDTSGRPGPVALPERIVLATDRPRRRLLERTSPSSKEGGTRVDVRFHLGLTDPDGGARARGTLVHAWLEHLEWIEDGLPVDAELRAIAGRQTPDLPEARVREHLDWLRRKLDAPAVRAALSRVAAPQAAEDNDVQTEVLAEVPFLVRDGDALMEGYVDRLVVVREQGRVKSAAVLDYKTDGVPPGDAEALAARVEHYRPQIEAYRRAVALLYRLDPAHVSGTLIFLDPGEVREL